MPVSISVCEFYNYPVDMSVYNTRALFCVSREMNISFGHIAKQLVTDSFARATVLTVTMSCSGVIVRFWLSESPKLWVILSLFIPVLNFIPFIFWG